MLKKFEITSFLLGLVIFLVLLILFLLQRIKEIREDKQDFKNLLSATKVKETRFTDKEGNTHTLTQTAQVSDTKNLKNDPELSRMLKTVDAKLKNIQSLTASSMENNTIFIAKFKDSTVRDTIKIKCIEYSNNWFSIKGCDGDTLRATFTDTIVSTTYLKRKKIFFLRIGKQTAWTEIVNKNPNNKIHITNAVIRKK